MFVILGGIALGLAVLVNFLFIVHKLKQGRYGDAIVDVGVMIAASMIYGTSLMGGVSATFGSMFISIYLLYYPLNLFNTSTESEKSSPKKAAEKPVTDSNLHWTEKFDKLFD